jgi:hypothetical protein
LDLNILNGCLRAQTNKTRRVFEGVGRKKSIAQKKVNNLMKREELPQPRATLEKRGLKAPNCEQIRKKGNVTFKIDIVFKSTMIIG